MFVSRYQVAKNRQKAGQQIDRKMVKNKHNLVTEEALILRKKVYQNELKSLQNVLKNSRFIKPSSSFSPLSSLPSSSCVEGKPCINSINLIGLSVNQSSSTLIANKYSSLNLLPAQMGLSNYSNRVVDNLSHNLMRSFNYRSQSAPFNFINLQSMATDSKYNCLLCNDSLTRLSVKCNSSPYSLTNTASSSSCLHENGLKKSTNFTVESLLNLNKYKIVK